MSARLVILWSLSLAASVLAGALLVGFARQSLSARDEQATAVAQTGCGLIRDQIAFYAVGVPPGAALPPRADLAAALALALADLPDTTAGIWHGAAPWIAVQGGRAGAIRQSGSRHALFPARKALQPLLARALTEDTVAAASDNGLFVSACALPGPWPDLVAWVASPGGAPAGLGNGVLGGWDGDLPWGLHSPLALRLGVGLGPGLGALLVLIIGIAVWSSWLLLGWRSALGRLEAAVRGTGVAGQAAELRPAGEPGLDAVIVALNDSTARLAEAQAQGAKAARLAALGRVAAGVAHEVRNPIAAIRLRTENAIAGSEARRAAALPAILTQVTRLERLTEALLDMTRPRQARPVRCDIAALCRQIAEGRLAVSRPKADIALDFDVEPAQACVDAELMEAALGNLVLNAAQHARRRVVVSGGVSGRMVRIRVSDDGPGIAPELRSSLFEPFVSGRADGTGLGLAIAREAVAAHGGRIFLAEQGASGSAFVIEITQ